MKGALMKIGQMASYLDDGLPEPVRDALASLQQDAPPMSAELTARGRARRARRRSRASCSREWDPEPIAAASIGQVHRAVTHSGLPVAVKVQYPGVDDAIRADLVNTDLLFRVLGMMFPGPRSRARSSKSCASGSPRSSTTATKPRTNASSPTRSPAIRSSRSRE